GLYVRYSTNYPLKSSGSILLVTLPQLILLQKADQLLELCIRDSREIGNSKAGRFQSTVAASHLHAFCLCRFLDLADKFFFPRNAYYCPAPCLGVLNQEMEGFGLQDSVFQPFHPFFGPGTGGGNKRNILKASV